MRGTLRRRALSFLLSRIHWPVAMIRMTVSFTLRCESVGWKVSGRIATETTTESKCLSGSLLAFLQKPLFVSEDYFEDVFSFNA